jgi:hypothetical protein
MKEPIISVCPVCSEEFEQNTRWRDAQTFCSVWCRDIGTERTPYAMTLEDIGKELGLSSSRVDQIIQGALVKVRSKLEWDRLARWRQCTGARPRAKLDERAQ